MTSDCGMSAIFSKQVLTPKPQINAMEQPVQEQRCFVVRSTRAADNKNDLDSPAIAVWE